MAHYAKIENDKVVKVIRSNRPFADTIGGEWVRTSYNTRQGVHLRGNIPVRKNFAGVGYMYDRTLDAFLPPKIYNSWVLDKTTWSWKAPKACPNDGNEYIWNEEHLEWHILQR